MRRPINHSHFVLGSLAGACLALPASAEHYRVYLIGGQSNGNGRGDAAELSQRPLVAEGLDSPQTDVRFYWHKTQSTANGNLTQDAWIDLQPGSGHGVNSPAGHAVEFGSELSLGRMLADNDPSVNIAIIKYTHGGTNLHTQWAAGGANYTSFISTVSAGLQALEDDGHTYEPGGMVWIQGESDTGNLTNAGNYEANLLALIERIRQEVFGGTSPGGYTLPFVISGLSDSQYPTTIESEGTGPFLVRKAQETVAASGRQTAFVDTDGLPTYSNGAVHFDATAQVAIGKASAGQLLALEANDLDRDGLLNPEEVDLGTNPSVSDSDGDGQSDGFEKAAGTDPLDSSSFFSISTITTNGDEVHLTWPSRPGNLYSLAWSRDLQHWTVVEDDVPAEELGETTSRSFLVEESDGGAESIVVYDGASGLNGDFDTTAFDSSSESSPVTAGRLVQGGSLTGGGAGLFVLNRAQDATLFDGHSESGLPGFNFGGVAEGSQPAAASAGDSFFFQIDSGQEMRYEQISFYANQFGSTARIDLSYTIAGEDEVFVVRGLTPNPGNQPLALETVDFDDFETAEEVTWTFYLYGAGNEAHGVRFDDIKLDGTSRNELTTVVISNFTFTGPPWTAQKEPDFSTLASGAPSVDTDSRSVTSLLSNNGFTSGGYGSFYIRDFDGGTPGVTDGNDFVIFSSSASPGVGLNLGGAAASSPTSFLSFTVSPVDGPLAFGELSFYLGTNAANDDFDMELRAWDGVTETILGAVSHMSSASNEPVVLKTIDFADFSSESPIEFRLYGYNVDSQAGGIRLDDIVLRGPAGEGQTSGDNADSRFFRLSLQL
ncbi:MAG: sialate O-acetylesterase [Verrucomicrobiota bacterium JB023]|nr:sialate O-acetylesterase [Verrucomicrobiota bacterium JB023]